MFVPDRGETTESEQYPLHSETSVDTRIFVINNSMWRDDHALTVEGAGRLQERTLAHTTSPQICGEVSNENSEPEDAQPPYLVGAKDGLRPVQQPFIGAGCLQERTLVHTTSPHVCGEVSNEISVPEDAQPLYLVGCSVAQQPSK